MTQADPGAENEQFDALVEQLRSLLLAASHGRDEALRRLARECGQLDQERKQFEQERLELRNEITRLQQLLQDQARDLSMLAQVDTERAVLEQQCAALQQELHDLRALQTQMDQIKPAARPPAATTHRPGVPSASNCAEPEPAVATNAAPSQASRETRRIVTPCRVMINRPGWDDEVEGWAVERSQEGVAILVDEKYSVGTPLRVRSAKSPHATWLDIVVDNCDAERANFRLQCSFASPVTWADIQHLAG